MLLSKCDIKKSKYIKKQEASELFSNLGIKTPANKIPLAGPLLFQTYKMNEIANKSLLAGYRFMPEMNLRQPGFTYSAYALKKKTNALPLTLLFAPLCIA